MTLNSIGQDCCLVKGHCEREETADNYKTLTIVAWTTPRLQGEAFFSLLITTKQYNQNKPYKVFRQKNPSCHKWHTILALIKSQSQK